MNYLPFNCNDWVIDNFDLDLSGNILSIYESSDRIGQSCDLIFENSSGLNKVKEIKLNTGTGHGFIFKPIDEWTIPTIKWAMNHLNEP